MSDILAGETLAVDADGFRNAMSRIAAAVHVITTDGPAGSGGVTITAMTSVSDAPATVLFCLNRESRFAPVLAGNGVFCVNTLAAGADNVARAETFAGRGELDRNAHFERADWTRATTGAPVLQCARVALDCRITVIREIATHSIVLGEVVDIHLGDQDAALAYLERDYRAL